MYDCESANSKNSAKALSLRDINTLRLLYLLDPDISNFMPGETPGTDSKKNQIILGNSDKRISGKLQESIDYVKKHPDSALSWTNLGNVYAGAESYIDAITCYNKALALDPSFTEARSGIAICYDKAGDADNALIHFKKLVAQEPGNIGYSYNLALFLKKNKKSTDAYNVLKSLIKANPDAAHDKNIKNLINSF